MDLSFLEVFGIIITVLYVIGSGLAILASNETPESRQARITRHEQQDWVSAQSQRRTRAEAEYRENAHAKIDASRRSPATKAA